MTTALEEAERAVRLSGTFCNEEMCYPCAVPPQYTWQGVTVKDGECLCRCHMPTALEAVELGIGTEMGRFCERHFSWLCGTTQGDCQREWREAVAWKRASATDA